MDDVNRNISIIEHILSYCQEIAEMVKRFGDSFEDFNSDSAYRHACSMCIFQIGELTAHLTDDFKQAYDDIPWRSMKAMRNVAAHHYSKFDIETLWESISEDIPALKDYCASVLDQDELSHDQE